MSQVAGELGQLIQLKQTFDRQSGAVVDLQTNIKSQLSNTHWVGAAADRFRAAWDSEFEPALRKLQAALSEAGAEVGRRHDMLQQAGS